MTDYTELVKDLRYCASTECTCGECKHNNEMCCETMLLEQAADAIEELETIVESYRNRMRYVPEPPKEDA